MVCFCITWFRKKPSEEKGTNNYSHLDIESVTADISDCCKICMNEKNTCFFECSHSVCSICFNKLNICPFCRSYKPESKTSDKTIYVNECMRPINPYHYPSTYDI